MAKQNGVHKVLRDDREDGGGKFHVVHFRQYNPKADKLESRRFEVFLNNRPYLKVDRRTDPRGMSRRQARSFCKLLNGEAKWPS